MLRDEDFTIALLPTIAQMPRLRLFNMARNGQLTHASSVGLIKKMSENWIESGSEQPLPLEHLTVSGTKLFDSGVSELLPLLATPAFGKFKRLNVTATQLTQACQPAFIKFLSE